MPLDPHGYMMLSKTEKASVDLWLEAHGLVVKETITAEVSGDNIIVTQMLQRDGKPYAIDGKVATRKIVVPLTRPAPPCILAASQ